MAFKVLAVWVPSTSLSNGGVDGAIPRMIVALLPVVVLFCVVLGVRIRADAFPSKAGPNLPGGASLSSQRAMSLPKFCPQCGYPLFRLRFRRL